MELNDYPEINDVYGDMIILEYLGSNQNHVKKYRVKCSVCGGIKILALTNLKKLSRCFHLNKDIGSCSYVERLDENIGLQINDYTVIKHDKNTKDGRRYIAKCNVCGIEFSTLIHNFKRGYGTNHSECGHHIPACKYINRFRKIYSCMRYRTTSPNYNEYHLYGGRGISSEYYSDFIIFYKELFDSYVSHVIKYGTKDTTLDRIDPDGNYETTNCRWATCKEQADNKRFKKDIIVITQKGEALEFKTLEEACLKLKFNKGSAYNAMRSNKTYKGNKIIYKSELTGIER